MTNSRARMRFAKEGDLRWISHRDLVRTFERMFRRAGVKLGMTQGYHPRPKLTFPSALALGVSATDEVMEFLLAEEAADPMELQARIQAAAPPGLTIGEISITTMQDPKVTVGRVQYSLPLPKERVAAARDQADTINASAEYFVEREDGTQVDLRSHLEQIRVEENELHMTLALDASGGTKPTDILRALQLEDLLLQGRFLTRTKVETRT